VTTALTKAVRTRASGLNELKANSLGALVMLVLEFGLGVGVNLYAKIPSGDAGKSFLPAFGSAVTGGPIILTLHALLGTLLLIAGISAVVRAALSHAKVLLTLASVALIAVVGAWQFGARFVGSQANASSMAMAIAAGVAIICYALILSVVPSVAATRQSSS
jgi:hypothetical protein